MLRPFPASRSAPFFRSVARGSRWVVVGFSFASALGCGGNQSTANSPDSVKVAAAPPREVAEPEIELLPPAPSPAAAPPGVVFRARISAPLLVADRALEAAGLPLKTEDFLEELKEEEGTFSALLDEIDFSGSLEFILSLEPGEKLDKAPNFVTSVGVRSMTKALKALREARIDVVDGPGGSYYFHHEKAHCALGRSRGTSAYRAVCSDREKGLSSLVKYALAGMPDETRGGGDNWFELDLVPIREKYGSRARGLKLLASVGARQLHRDHPRFDRAITDAAVALAEELGDLLADADRARGEFRQSERGDLTLDLGVEFGQVTSWYAHLLSDMARNARPAPAPLLELPSSLSTASYAVGVPPERFGKMGRWAADLAGGFLESKGAPAALVRDVEFLVEESFVSPEMTIQAGGAARLDSAGKFVGGWGLYGTTRSPESTLKWLDAAGRVTSSSYWKTLEPKADGAFSLKRSKEKLSSAPRATLYTYRLSDALLNEVRELDAAEKAGVKDPKWVSEVSLGGYLAVSSVGPYTALVYAKDKAGLERAFQDLADKKSPSLGSVEELKGPLSQPHASAGFLRVSAILGIYGLILPESLTTRLSKLLESTPNGGAASMFFATSGETKGKGLRFHTQYEIPAAFIGDIAALVGLAAAELKDEFGD
jgi:hypothetical protein